MSGICSCNLGMSNTGIPGCVGVSSVLKRMVAVNLYDSTGAANKVDPAGTLNQAWMTALLNQTDVTKRFYPSPEIKNITTDKGDPVYETYEDGSKNFVREDIRTFKGMIPKCPPLFKKKIESIRCNTVGVYFIDIDGNLIGLTKNNDGYLYPMPINVQSVYGKVQLGTDKATTQLDISYDFPATMYDGDISQISADAFTDFQLNDIVGLIDVTVVISAISTTGFTMALTTPYGPLNNKVSVEGIVTADLKGNTGTASKIYDVTSTTDKTVSSVTESTTVPGKYVVVFTTAATSADVMRLRITKNGFVVPDTNITIP